MTKEKTGNKLSVLDELRLAGHSVVGSLTQDKTEGIALADFDPRTPDERVRLMTPRVIVLQDRTTSGKAMKSPRTITVRQMAVWPANRNSKARPTQEIGLTVCRETDEVFYLWSHITKQNGQFMPKVYDLAPEALMEMFKQFQDSAASTGLLNQSDRAALGLVG